MATIAASLVLAANPMSFFSSFLIMAAASMVDSYIISALTPGSEMSQGQVNDLSVQTCTVGTGMARGYGKVRLTGNIIWGTKFTEHIKKTTTSSGGKGGGGAKTTTTTDLTETLPHTWQRNSRAIGICFAGCYGAEPHNGFDTDFGDYPPTQAQMDGVCQAIAILCEELGLPVDYEHVKTHCEAAEEDDYGPSTTCERWDLWYLPDLPNEEAVKHGGEVIRGKTAWWQKKTDHNI